jgi:hypothetical protein
MLLPKNRLELSGFLFPSPRPGPFREKKMFENKIPPRFPLCGIKTAGVF